MQNKIKVFENKQVRTLWNADEEEWYFSVVDVCNVLADSASKDPGILAQTETTLKKRRK